MAEFPARWEADVVLADGKTVHVRPIRPDDEARLVALRERMSDESLYYRFHGAAPKFTPERVAYFTHVNYVDRMALVAVLGDEIVAVARYDRLGTTDEAEVAFAVDDPHQGRGIGTLLLEHLAAAARANGIARFRAHVLANNRRMLGVFRDAGWTVESHLERGGVVEVTFEIRETEASLAAIWDREHRAEAASIRRLLYPRSVAVVGASRTPGTIGHELFLNLVRGNFAGPVHPVNPSADQVAGIPAFASVLDVPDPLDLAVVVVPAPKVPAVANECAKKGVGGLVVISAGFSETGPVGHNAERALVETARAHGMRVVGPNCLGLVNTDPEVRLNATFAPFAPEAGPVGFLSQSGAFGIALIETATRLRLGISAFVSVGNKADVSGNDLLQYWEDDDATRVILLYLESFGNPRKFARLARRVARKKPIVALKGGRTDAGARAAASHTAAAASPDLAVDALFHQAGVIRVQSVAELFDVAQLLAFQPLPKGNRLAIISNGGGPGILAADAAERLGLEVPELSPETQSGLRAILPDGAAVTNPVDLVAGATAETYAAALNAVGSDPAVDVLLVQFTPPLVTGSEDVARAIAATPTRDKTVATVFLAAGVPEGTRRDGNDREIDLPVYAYPEDAVRAIAHAVSYAQWRARPEGTVPQPEGINRVTARQIVAEFLSRRPEGGWLDPERAAALLRAYGISIVATEVVDNEDEALAAAARLGYPVALKAVGPTLVHKSDVGGVHLGLASGPDVRRAFAKINLALGDVTAGVAVVQPMVEGLELIVGVTQDPAFGPLVMFGLGGVATELLGDRAFRIVPVTDLDAAELVRAIRGAPLLFGYRGRPICNVAALEDLLVRVGHLADDLPELVEMDLNPLMASPDGAVPVDAKLRLAPPPPAEPPGRRMRAP